MNDLPAEAYAIIEGRHSDPFHYLGRHSENGRNVVRAYLPDASHVEVIDDHGAMTELIRLHESGLFAGTLPNGATRYHLRAQFGSDTVDIDDPYRFPPILGDLDLYLLGEGTHQRLYDKLGAHPMIIDANTTQLNRGEPLRDTAAVISRYVDAIVMRTFGQDRLEELAASGDDER